MRIANYLIERGISPCISGFDYIHEAINILSKDKEPLKEYISCLCPMIAEKYKVKSTSVERAIRYAVSLTTPKKTPKQFIANALIELSK